MLLASRLEDNLSLDADAALHTWDPALHAAAQQEGGDLTAAQRLFWTNILICNSLIVEKDPATGRYKYQVRRARRRELSGAAAACLASPSRVLAAVPLCRARPARNRQAVGATNGGMDVCVYVYGMYMYMYMYIYILLVYVYLCTSVTWNAADGAHCTQGPSPDEVALVEGAARLGFCLSARSSDKLTLSFLGRVRAATAPRFCCVGAAALARAM